MQNRKLQIFWTEIVTPLRHAVGFVDGKQRNGHAFHQMQKTWRQQALRRNVEQIDLARERVALHAPGFVDQLRGIEKIRAHAKLFQLIHLVLHQGNQRRNNDADAIAQQRGDLVTQGLATARGHQHQCVTAARHLADNLGLLAAKSGVTKSLIEYR